MIPTGAVKSLLIAMPSDGRHLAETSRTQFISPRYQTAPYAMGSILTLDSDGAVDRGEEGPDRYVLDSVFLLTGDSGLY